METVEQHEERTPQGALPVTTQPPRVRPPRRIYSALSVVAAVLLAALLTQALLATPGGSLIGPHALAPGTPGLVGLPGGDQSRLYPGTLNSQPGIDYNAVAMISPSDGWLFGGTFSQNGADSSLIFHYDGTQWQRVPAPATAPITAVSMLSSTDGWATSRDTVLHYTGGAWTIAHTFSEPNHTVFLTAIAMVSPDEGWLGATDDGPSSASGMLLHYVGGQWRQVPLPDANTSTNVSSISMLSPREGWALETSFDSATGAVSTQLIHYLNGVWHRVGSPIPVALTSLSAVSSQAVWMVGSVTGVTGGIFEYDGNQIAQVSSPTPNILHAVMMLSPTDGWAVGDGAATLHWDGARWTKVGLIIHGVALGGISFPTSSEGWAVGDAVTSSADQQATLLHYRNGAWSVYTLKIGG